MTRTPMVGAGLEPAPRHRRASARGEEEKIMLTYEVDAGFPSVAQAAGEELYRVEFRAPVVGFDGETYDDVLIWIDNMTRAGAEALREDIPAHPDHRRSFCRRCPNGVIPSPHEHDSLPEERGWLHSEITHLRIMPMREAV